MSNQITVYEQPQALGFQAPTATLDTILRAYQLKKDFIDKVLHKGTDYGTIPGAGDKPALLKPGSEKLISLYGLAPTFEDVSVIEDWTGEAHGGEPLFYYRLRCKLHRVMADGTLVLAGSAEGSCNSREKKYRYRQSERVCPACGKSTIIKGKQEYGGGFICFAKKGGCGAKFSDTDPAIVGQQVGQILNPDIPELVNTILKMAEKRALVAATLIVTGASDYFTQDIEDYYIDGDYTPAPAVQPVQPQAQPVQAQPVANVAGPDAWAKWDDLADEATAFGLPVYVPAQGCTVDELRAAYRALKAQIHDARLSLGSDYEPAAGDN